MAAGYLIHSIFVMPRKGESASHRSDLFSPRPVSLVVCTSASRSRGALLPWAGRSWVDRTPPEGPRAGAVKSRALEGKQEPQVLSRLSCLLGGAWRLPEALSVVR